jgi:hypothetical protein
METLEQIDARIAELEDEQEILRMKVARNALTPLGRLPDDLLLDIVQAWTAIPTIPDSEMMYIATAVYAHLRALLIATPSLWTNVELGQSQALVKRHITRASPFHLQIGGCIDSKDTLGQAIQLLPRASRLCLQIQDLDNLSVAALVVAALAAADISKLTSLRLQSIRRANYQVDLSSILATHLLVLELDMKAQWFPALPALLRLTLKRTQSTVSEIHKLLVGSMCLEHIDLNQSIDAEHDTPSPALARVNLPYLVTLSIEEERAVTLALFSVLPNPSIRLFLDMSRGINRGISRGYTNGSLVLSSSAHPVGPLLTRIAQFWSEVHGADTPSPLPWIRSSDREVTFGISSETSTRGYAADDAALVLRISGCILVRDPVLEEIDMLHIEGGLVSDLTRFDLGMISHAQRVILSHVDIGRPEDAESFLAWIRGQVHQGRPLQSIEFQFCKASVRPLFDQLNALQAAQSINWQGRYIETLRHEQQNSDGYD